MTELWACTDCPAEVDFDTRAEHMRTEHGVNHALPEPVCCTDDVPCERAKALEGEPTSESWMAR